MAGVELSQVVSFIAELFNFAMNVILSLPITTTITVGSVFLFIVVLGVVLWFSNVISTSAPEVQLDEPDVKSISAGSRSGPV